MKKYRILIKNILIASLLCISIAIPTQAQAIKIIADGWDYEGIIEKNGGYAYVSVREFASAMDNAVVSWDEAERKVTVVTDHLYMTIWENGNYIIANDRYLWCPAGTYTENGIMMVPLTAVSRAFGFNHFWSAEEGTAYLTRQTGGIDAGENTYDEEDVLWLARIIHAEAQGEPFLGKVAVGEVVLNRVKSEEFPDAIYDVIFDDAHGVQFTPTKNGTIYNEPGEDSIIAAKLCLDGAKVHGNLLYFLNPEKAVSAWVPKNRPYRLTIGEHDFYA